MDDKELFKIWWMHNKHRYSATDRELCIDEIEVLMGCLEFKRYVFTIRLDELKTSIADEICKVGEWLRRIFRKA